MIAREMTTEGEECPKEYAVHPSWILGVLQPINSVQVFPPVAHNWDRDLVYCSRSQESTYVFIPCIYLLFHHKRRLWRSDECEGILRQTRAIS